jgi:hypothetical protein
MSKNKYKHMADYEFANVVKNIIYKSENRKDYSIPSTSVREFLRVSHDLILKLTDTFTAEAYYIRSVERKDWNDCRVRYAIFRLNNIDFAVMIKKDSFSNTAHLFYSTVGEVTGSDEYYNRISVVAESVIEWNIYGT